MEVSGKVSPDSFLSKRLSAKHQTVSAEYADGFQEEQHSFSSRLDLSNLRIQGSEEV